MSELLGKRVFGSAGGSSPQLTVQVKQHMESCVYYYIPSHIV